MNHHELDKIKMKNDIVLTVALIVSMIVVRIGMHLLYLCTSEYNAAIFFTSSFICVKITYNLFNKFVDKYMKRKRK